MNYNSKVVEKDIHRRWQAALAILGFVFVVSILTICEL